jgi:hypothetical protein
MRSFVRAFEPNQHEIVWLQQRFYNFDSFVSFGSEHPIDQRVLFDDVSIESRRFVDSVRSLFWDTSIPFDMLHWWDVRGMLATLYIEYVHVRGYSRSLQSTNFTDQLVNQPIIDLAIIDHIMHEGGGLFAIIGTRIHNIRRSSRML